MQVLLFPDLYFLLLADREWKPLAGTGERMGILFVCLRQFNKTAINNGFLFIFLLSNASLDKEVIIYSFPWLETK